MSIAFNEDTLGVWYVLLEPKKSDYMGGLSKRDYGYMYTWRIRYYATPDDPWDGKDKKQWYHIQIPSSRGDAEEVVAIIREMVHATVALGKAFGKPETGPIYELIRGNKSMDQFTNEFMSAPFVHKKVVQ